MDIAARIKDLRGPIRQEDFAEMVGVKKNTIGRWERGEQHPGFEELNRILSLHPEINPAWLLTGEGPRERGPLVNDELRHQAAEAAGEYSKAPHWHMALTRAVAGIVEAEAERRLRELARKEIDPRLRDLKWWIEDFWKDADEERRTWLIVEMKRVYPEFREWLESKEKKEKSIACDCEPMEGFTLF
jgi:transcriptional regulator with XRE-family HTH domain